MSGGPWQDYAAAQPAPAGPWADYRRPGEQPRIADGVVDSVIAGLQESATGLIVRGERPDVALGPDAAWYERGAAALAGVAADLPESIVGAVAGSVAGGAVGSAVPVIGTGAGAVIGGGAGAMAVPMAIREALMEAYDQGGAHSWGDVWDIAKAALVGGGKGAVIGGLTAGAGRVAGAAVDAAAPVVGKAALPATRIAAKTTAEISTIAAAGAGLEGRLPTSQDFVDAAIVLGGLHVATKAAGSLRTIYARTGKTPAEVIGDARQDPAIKESVLKGELPEAYKPLATEQAARAAVPEPGAKARAVEFTQQPFAEIPQAKGEPARPTHVNYEYINAPQDVAAAMSRLSSLYEAQIQAQRRGRVSWQQTEAEARAALADVLGTGQEAIPGARAPGTAANAAELLARKQMAVGAAETLVARGKALAEAAAKGEASEKMVADFLAQVDRTAMIQAEFLGARAEAGRALQILKDTTRAADQANAIRDALESYGGKGNALELAKRLADFTDPAQALKFAAEASKARTIDKVIEAWKAGLVSGPTTHLANVLGNFGFSLVRLPVDVIAGGFGALRSGPDRVVMGEAVGRAIGMFRGTAEGLRVAAETLKHEQTGGKAESQKAIKGKAGEVIRLPFRALSAEDALFRTMAERGEAYALAMRQAAAEGHGYGTREFNARAVELVNNPTPKMAEAIKAAGERLTFNERSELASAINSFLNRAPVLKFVVPFVRTPVNILEEVARMTPGANVLVKAWREDFKAGGARRDRALAETATGAIIAGTVVAGVLNGDISGAGSPDADERAAQYASGWQPYSIRIGDRWHSYQRLAPVGQLVGLIADAATIYQRGDEENAATIWRMAAYGFANAVTNQTFLKGVSDLVNVLQDPARYGDRWVAGLTASVVPGVLSQPARALDPYLRETYGILDAMKSRVPGLRETLPLKRDIFGQPVRSETGLSPIYLSIESADPVRMEAARLGVGTTWPRSVTLPGKGDRKLRQRELTPEERDRYAAIAGQFAHEVLSQVIARPDYASLPDVAKVDIFKRVFQQARRKGAAEALDPEARLAEIQRIAAEVAAQYVR